MANVEDRPMKDMTEEVEQDLFKTKESLALTPDVARFYRSAGDLISLDVTLENGETEHYERVVPVRAFPITDPEEFISIKEPDSKETGKGREIGMIRRLADLDGETVALIREELSRRYFTPEIKRITSVKEKFGYSYWDAETSAGKGGFNARVPRTDNGNLSFVLHKEKSFFVLK